MLHLRSAVRPLAMALPLILSVSVMAAEPALIAVSAKPVSTLDLSTPPITEVLTQKEIDEVLSRTFEPRRLEEVEVNRSRVNDPTRDDYIPPGFAALFWAAGKPSGFWKLFTPMLVQKPHDDINPTNHPTNLGQPAPGIPAMAGEGRPFDR